jgi:hypothetical protein
MKSFINQKKDIFLNLFYPNLCLHCLEKLEDNNNYFCESCLVYFSYLPVNNNNYNAVFETTYPVLTLIKELKNQKILSMSKIAASFMAIQHHNLSWPHFDKIIPLNNKKIFKDHIYYLAKDLTKYFFEPKKPITNNILFVSDILDLNELEMAKKKFSNNNIYAMGLCFANR